MLHYLSLQAHIIWHAINDSGCAYYFSFTISDSSLLDVSTSTTTTTCGESTGTVSFTLNTGTNPVSINNGAPVTLPTTMSGLSAGNYDWDLEDADGCMFTTSFTINAIDGLDITSTPTPTTCDLDNGAVEFTINQGTEPVTYTDNGVAITTFTDLSPGNYVWDAEDANGCNFQVSFYILFSDKLNVEITSTTTTTCGLDNGSLSYSVIDGLEPITFTEAGSPVDINQLPEGLHTYVAIDANGCTQTLSTIGIGSSDPLVSVAQPHATTCGVADNGWVEIFTVTGTHPVTYTENGVVMSLTDLTPGDYNWDTEDASGCTGQVSFTIEESEVFEVTAGNPSGTITTRCNEDNGVVFLYHNGGPTQSLSIEDANGAITSQPFCVSLVPSGQACIISDLPAGTFNWTCTDGNGCVDQVSFTVEESDPLDIIATPTATSCDLANGEVSFTVNTGTSPITYSDNGTPITNFTGLASGDYSWNAEDPDGCTFLVNFTIDPSIEATFTTTPTHTFCDGNNGSVVGAMITGNGFLTYTLNGVVNTTGIYNNLAPGTYTMTAVDNVFCPASSTFTINGSSPLEVSTVVTPTFCNEDNGSITATLDSGTTPVNYTIAGQGTNTSGTFIDLAPGTYTMNAVDAVGCEATETFTIAPSVPLDINTVIIHTTCELDNGSVTATLLSGTTPVTFIIAGEGSNTIGEFDDLSPGNYTLNAEDAQGCQATVSFVIDDSTLPLIDMETVRSSCGDVNGSIQLTPDVNTGRAPYEYNIGGAWTAEKTFDDLNPGNYTVTIRDADECTTSQETTILDSEQLVFTNHIDHADCGNLSGVITLITLHGTGPFLYSISNEFVYRQNNFGTFGNVEAGQYTATVIGTDGCIVTQELIVEDDPGVRLDVEINHPACGETNGSITFNLGKSGTAPYKVYLDDNLMEDSLYSDYFISDMANGDYKIEVSDYYGCGDYAEITINDGNSIVDELVINHIDCDGSLGSISTTIGDPGDYTFTLEGETNTDGSFPELEAGSYMYTATDSMGCDYTKEIIILDNSLTDVRVLIINNDCSDLSNIKIIPENGNGPYRFFINGKQYFENGATDLESGFYNVAVIDANGCSVIQEIKIEGESKLTYTIEKCREPKFGNPGFLVVQAIGGEAPYRYHLDQYRSKKGLFINLYKETYTLTIIDNLGCSSSFEIKLCGDEYANKGQYAQGRNNELSDVSIYPNPGSNVLNIEHSSEFENQKIEVYGSAGQLIKLISINPKSDTTTINTQEWSKGIYFIKIGSTRMIKWFKV